MAYPQVIIPPSVRPVSPLELNPTDDLTTPFAPRFSRGTTQRQVWGDPVWTAQARFEGLSGADRARLKAAIMGARGGASNILMTPGIPLRGSFPATELFTNSDFSNGTTGWTGQYATLSVADRVLRMTADGSTLGNWGVQQSVSGLTQYALYAMRGFINPLFPYSAAANGVYYDGAHSSSVGGQGLFTRASVALSTSYGVYPAVFDVNAVNALAGQVGECLWSSFSRCILADAGPNALTYSDQIDNAAWIKIRGTVTPNAATAPDGTATADGFTEDASAATTHLVYQSVTVSSSAADFSFSVSLKASSRTWALVYLLEGTGGHNVYAYINLSTGALGTVGSGGANFTNQRASVVSQGSGWYRVSITGKKTNAATALDAVVMTADADLDTTINSPGSGFYIWGASVAQSSLPVRYVATTSTAATGTSQTGSSIYVKGLPASTSGLLKAGDFVEINGELMQATASLDSDAAGLGVLQGHRRPTTAIADNIPIIVNNPFGTFRLASDPRITERFGVYTDVDLQLIEATA